MAFHSVDAASRRETRGSLINALVPGAAFDVVTHANQQAATAGAHSLAPRATRLANLAFLLGCALIVALCLWVDTLGQLHKTGFTLAGYTLDARPGVGGAVLLYAALALASRVSAVEWLREVALAFVGAAVLAISAQLIIPLPNTPVPITGQTFAVLLIGAAYGWRRGAVAVALYLTLGTAGLPVFAAIPGAASYGYLAGFFVAAVVVGWLAEHGWDRSLPRALVAMLLGEVVIYACGLLWLAAYLGWNWRLALTFGLTPFLIGDALKLLAAALVLPAAWWVTRRALGTAGQTGEEAH
ncbi:MAG: biotin transporter BioY [Ktedonobacterales bacterium]